MGVGSEGKGERGGVPSPRLSHMIMLMCFSTNTRSVKTSQLSSNVLFSALIDVKRQGCQVRELSTKFFEGKWPEIF